MSEEEKKAETPTSATESSAAGAPVDGDKKKSKKRGKEHDAEFEAATTIHVKMYSPFQVYFDEEADSVTAENATGTFDILPRHHNFITLLRPGEVEIRSAKNGDKVYTIARGVMHVHKNVITIFLDV